MKTLRWKLREVLNARGISLYKLGKALEGQVGRTSLHDIAAGRSTATGLDKIEAIMQAIEKESGREVALSEVLEWA